MHNRWLFLVSGVVIKGYNVSLQKHLIFVTYYYNQCSKSTSKFNSWNHAHDTTSKLFSMFFIWSQKMISNRALTVHICLFAQLFFTVFEVKSLVTIKIKKWRLLLPFIVWTNVGSQMFCWLGNSLRDRTNMVIFCKVTTRWRVCKTWHNYTFKSGIKRWINAF